MITDKIKKEYSEFIQEYPLCSCSYELANKLFFEDKRKALVKIAKNNSTKETFNEVLEEITKYYNL
jgi:hypothetical protein